MSDYVCNRCCSPISIPDNERPWAVVRLLPKLEEVPLCLKCINEVKPRRFSALGCIPNYEVHPWKELTEYPKMAETEEQIAATRLELFGPSGLGKNFKMW